jgi:hypothetical protein
VLRAFRLAVLSLPGRKNPLSKGRSTSCVCEALGALDLDGGVDAAVDAVELVDEEVRVAHREVLEELALRLRVDAVDLEHAVREHRREQLVGRRALERGSFRSSSPVSSLNATRLPASGSVVSKRFPPTNAARLSSESLRTGSFVRSISQSMRARQLSFRHETPKAYSGP